MIESERIADRQHPLTDFNGIGIGEASCGQPTFVDLDDGEIGLSVGVDDLGLILPSVVQCDANLVGARDNVAVGHDVAVFTHDHAAALADLFSERPIIWFNKRVRFLGVRSVILDRPAVRASSIRIESTSSDALNGCDVYDRRRDDLCGSLKGEGEIVGPIDRGFLLRRGRRNLGAGPGRRDTSRTDPRADQKRQDGGDQYDTCGA